jgi:hypothetical protein
MKQVVTWEKEDRLFRLRAARTAFLMYLRLGRPIRR